MPGGNNAEYLVPGSDTADGNTYLVPGLGGEGGGAGQTAEYEYSMAVETVAQATSQARGGGQTSSGGGGGQGMRPHSGTRWSQSEAGLGRQASTYGGFGEQDSSA